MTESKETNRYLDAELVEFINLMASTDSDWRTQYTKWEREILLICRHHAELVEKHFKERDESPIVGDPVRRWDRQQQVNNAFERLQKEIRVNRENLIHTIFRRGPGARTTVVYHLEPRVPGI